MTAQSACDIAQTGPASETAGIAPNTFSIGAPHGGSINIPLAFDPRSDPYLALDTDAKIRSYYDTEGYVVIRGAIDPGLCDEARAAFANEVKPYRGYIYRQASAIPEKNIFTEHGHVLNSLLNIQDLDRRRFPRFRDSGVRIITHASIQRAVRILVGESGKLTQSMYFDGNPATWAHQDAYYLDSTDRGRMTAVWVAAEDIHPGAGRFFVYPRSHLIDMEKNGGGFDVAFNHDRYKKLVIDTIRSHRLTCRAPALRKGDLLFWSVRTIHGSLETRTHHSRASFTSHFVPESTTLLQFETRPRKLNLHLVNGVQVHHPKDQNQPLNRGILRLETTFPRAFQATKRLAVKALTR
jgi:phytanoyl-CoA hydroxylase